MKAIVFDKTGTLTIGKPVVTEIISFDISENELLKFASSIEKKSEHPVGQAIYEYAKGKNIKIEEPEKFNSITGKGVEGLVASKKIIAGNKNFIILTFLN
jgi:Cu+-exporting ATPase